MTQDNSNSNTYWAYDYFTYGYVPSSVWNCSQPEIQLDNAPTAEFPAADPTQEPDTDAPQSAGILNEIMVLVVLLISAMPLFLFMDQLTQSINTAAQNTAAEVGMFRPSSFKF